MTNAQAYAMLVGIALPFIVGLLSKATWAHWVKFLILVFLSFLTGTGFIYWENGLDFSSGQWLLTIAAVVAAAQSTYAFGIKNIPGLKEWLADHLVK